VSNLYVISCYNVMTLFRWCDVVIILFCTAYFELIVVLNIQDIVITGWSSVPTGGITLVVLRASERISSFLFTVLLKNSQTSGTSQSDRSDMNKQAVSNYRRLQSWNLTHTSICRYAIQTYDAIRLIKKCRQ